MKSILIKIIRKMTKFVAVTIIIAFVLSAGLLNIITIKPKIAQAHATGGINPGSGYSGQYGYTITADGGYEYTLNNLSTHFYCTHRGGRVDNLIENDTQLGGWHSGGSYDGWHKAVTLIELKGDLARTPQSLTWTMTSSRTNTGRDAHQSDEIKMNISSQSEPYTNHSDSSDQQVLSKQNVGDNWELSMTRHFLHRYIRLVVYINGHYQISQYNHNFRLKFTPTVTDIPSSGYWQSGGNSTWSAIDSAGEHLLTTGTRTRDNPPSALWSSGATAAGNNDLRYNGDYHWGDGITRSNGHTSDTELIMDQGGSGHHRSLVHWTTIPLSPAISEAIAQGNISMTFSTAIGNRQEGDAQSQIFIAWGSGGHYNFQFSSIEASNYSSLAGAWWHNMNVSISGARPGISSVRVGLYQRRGNNSSVHSELYAKNMKLIVTGSSPNYNAGFLSHGSGGLNGTGQYNVYHRDQGSLYGTNVSDISNVWWCPSMNNSHSGGTGAGPYAPSVSPVTSQSGLIPFDPSSKPVVSFLPFTNNEHIPSAVSVVAPSIGAINVGNIPAPEINNLGLIPIPSVATERATDYTTVSAIEADAATNSVDNIHFNNPDALRPLDAYHWKDPVQLSQELFGTNRFTDVASHNRSTGGTFGGSWARYDIYGSGRWPWGTIDDNRRIWINIHTTEATGDIHLYVPAAANDKPNNILIDFRWDGSDNTIRVHGPHKVFIYLMGNNAILLRGGDYVGGEGGGEHNRESQLYFIGVGGGNYFEVRNIPFYASIYMPKGRSTQYGGPLTRRLNEVRFTGSGGSKNVHGTIVSDVAWFDTVEGSNHYYDFSPSTQAFPSQILFFGHSMPINWFMNAPEQSNVGFTWTPIGVIYG